VRLFLDMFESLGQNVFDMLVRDGVIDVLPGLAGFYEARAAQKPELVGDRRVVHAQERCDVTHAQFGRPQGEEDLYAGRVSEELEEVRYLVHDPLVPGQELFYPADSLFADFSIGRFHGIHAWKCMSILAGCQEQGSVFKAS